MSSPHATRFTGPAAAPPDPVEFLAPAPADALPAVKPPFTRVDLLSDVEFPAESPYQVLEVSTERVSWSGVAEVCRFVSQWVAIIAVAGAAIVAGYYVVFHLVPALLEGLVSLVSVALSALAAGIKSALYLIGKIAAAILGAFFLLMFYRSLVSRAESVSDEPAPGQPLRPANNTRSAVNNSAKTTVVTVINNLHVE